MTPAIEPHRISAHVLVVDDEPHIRNLICRALTRQGCTCATAADASEAWEYLSKHAVDLVTLDLRMPGRPGIDLLRTLQESFADIAVIVLTGRTDIQNAIAALTYGACAYLIKPIDTAELVFHVLRGVERRSLILERRRYTEHLEETVTRQTAAIREAHEETILRLMNASMHHDEETGAHVRRVGLCSEILARSLGWRPSDAAMIRLAAPMHDVGKIGIPDAILRKNGKLTAEEFAVMKSHTTIGASLLANSGSPMLQLAERIAHSHHERWDGTGYPQGLSGDAIPAAARIVAVADVYDALTHDRVYRPAIPERRALQMIHEGRGTHFDPDVLDVFFDIVAEIREVRWSNPDQERLPVPEPWLEPGIAPCASPTVAAHPLR